MKRPLLLAAILAFTTAQTVAASSGTADVDVTRALEVKRQPSDIKGVDWTASYEFGPFRAVYQAETHTAHHPTIRM